MKVTEHLAKGQAITFEIIPPLRGGSIDKLEAVVQTLAKYDPPFIDVTSHAAQADYVETEDAVIRKIRRKRPGTIGICAIIQHKYKIDAVPHVICQGFTQQETEDFLIELHYNGNRNILAIRGDDPGFKKNKDNGRTHNTHAINLVSQIRSLNRGEYLDEDLLDKERTDFCIGVAGYPEKHFQSPNLSSDINHLKAKIDAGADYIVTQMFFDNTKYFDYVAKCREVGITAPIIPGIKIITSKNHLKTLPAKFHLDIPYDLSSEVSNAKGHVADVGIEWAENQVTELLAGGAPAVHIYVMQDVNPVENLLSRLKL